jgi:Sulfatase
MNILYLHAHDAGRQVQPYGFPCDNPNLMAFAREAVLFRKAFCAAPTCAPSRAALTSGQYPHQVGMYGLTGQQGWRFDDYGKHWVQQFNRWGYETVLAGVQHEADHKDFSCLGYQRVLENEPPARVQPGECYPETIAKVESFLATLREIGAAIILRCPIIPGANDSREHLARIKELEASGDFLAVERLPFHATGNSKYTDLERPVPSFSSQPGA